jgi:hypothetical protein
LTIFDARRSWIFISASPSAQTPKGGGLPDNNRRRYDIADHENTPDQAYFTSLPIRRAA